uniref:Suppressor of cytokine signaling 2 n=2 Tax=Catarrhini TaxID=9526 RepID=A0A8C9J2T4_9PRIM
MTLRCLEPSGNGGEGTRSQWGTAGSAEEPSPEAARLAKALRELGQTGWYWGSMTVNEAKEKLKEAPEGTFLIRDSSHSDYLLTISVKTSAGPTNLRIEYQDGKFRLDSIICVKSKLKQFDSVVHLIDYYVQMCKDKRTGPEAPRNGTVHLYLTNPLYTAAPSLQHLCRLTINKCTGAIWGLPLPTRLKDYLEEYKFQGFASLRERLARVPVREKEISPAAFFSCLSINASQGAPLPWWGKAFSPVKPSQNFIKFSYISPVSYSVKDKNFCLFVCFFLFC